MRVHNFRLLARAGGQPAGLAKMRRRFLRGPKGHLLLWMDKSLFAMYLQIFVQRARVPLWSQGDGWVERPFPADFGGAHRSAPPAPRRTYSLNFLDAAAGVYSHFL